MKFYLFKDEKLKLEVTDPTIYNEAYGRSRGTDYRLFQMEATVSKLQPSDDHRDDSDQKKICADLMKKLRHPVQSDGSAKKSRVERNPTLKIYMAVPNNRSKVFNKDNYSKKAITVIDGEFITALHRMRRSIPNADVSVKLTLHTDLLRSPPDANRTRRNFSVITDEMPITDKYDDYAEYCDFDFNMPDAVRNSLINSKDGRKFTEIGGKFTIEITLQNFEDSHVTLQTLNQTILNEAESADVVICTGDGKQVPCHRAFLAVSSVVLKAMLRSSSVHFQESPKKIEMPDMSEKGVRAFLAFLYYQDLTPAKEKIAIAWELLQAGDKYKVIPLRTSMEKILLENDEDSWWTVELALKIFAFMNTIDSDVKEDVKKKIIQVMKRNHSEWMSSEVYQKILRDNPVLVLHSELLRSAFSLCSCELSCDSDSDETTKS